MHNFFQKNYWSRGLPLYNYKIIVGMTDLIWIAFPGEIYCAINLKWWWLFGLQQQWDKSAAELDGSMPTATPNEMKHICGCDRRKYQGRSSSRSSHSTPDASTVSRHPEAIPQGPYSAFTQNWRNFDDRVKTKRGRCYTKKYQYKEVADSLSSSVWQRCWEGWAGLQEHEVALSK